MPTMSLPTTLLLGAVALLCVLLLVRLRRADVGKKAAFRPNPTTPDELAHAVFHAAVMGDLDAYRALFLAGPEVRQVLGKDAEDYLYRRKPESFKESLVTIAAMIPERSRYEGVEPTGGDSLAMKVRPPGGDPLVVGIGTWRMVGPVYRLHTPAFT